MKEDEIVFQKEYQRQPASATVKERIWPSLDLYATKSKDPIVNLDVDQLLFRQRSSC